jgi:hypothetical protein
VNPGDLELQALVALQERDEREMVVVAAAVGAALPPGAEVALAEGIGIRGLCTRGQLRSPRQEMFRDPRGVGVELLGPERRSLAIAEDQMHASRPAALDALDLAVVEQQLEDVGGLCSSPELCVVDLVRPGTKVRRLVDADDEIRVADPAVMQKARLMDDLAPLAHCSLRGGRAFACRAVAVERQHVAPLSAQRPQERLLVATTALEQQLCVGWRILLSPDLAAVGEQVQVRPMLTTEEVIQTTR